ncbi:hypothetical protein V9T40_013084 [Parthenolecanium corni]|uniref:Secreted protein n=1 Tax=Parthenolecanium corni TaxID=536013 RepID=A0AAN9Y5Q3_9HEMI
MSHLLVYFVANSCLFPIWSIAYAVDRRRSTQSDVLIFHGGDNLEPEPSADDVDPSDLRPLIDSQKERPEHKPPPCDRYDAPRTVFGRGAVHLAIRLASSRLVSSPAFGACVRKTRVSS